MRWDVAGWDLQFNCATCNFPNGPKRVFLLQKSYNFSGPDLFFKEAAKLFKTVVLSESGK